MSSICLQNIITRTGQHCRKGKGPVLQHRLKVQLPFEGGLSPFLEASARVPGHHNGWDWFEASYLSVWVSLLVKQGEDTRATSSQILLAPSLPGHPPDCRGWISPLAPLKFTETTLHGLSSSCSSRMWGSPGGKSAGTGFESRGEERRPVRLPATGARCPGCWESERKNVHGAGT